MQQISFHSTFCNLFYVTCLKTVFKDIHCVFLNIYTELLSGMLGNEKELIKHKISRLNGKLQKLCWIE